MAPERILIVDSEPKMISLLRQILVGAGYTTLAATRGQQAVQIIAKEQPALVLLSTTLSGDLDGFEVIRRVREFSEVPVILLSSRDESDDALRGFDLGADDYVVKPFDPKVLLARARAVLKRSQCQGQEPEEIICNNLVINPVARRVTLNNIEIYLTETEFNLLLALARHRNRVLMHDQLLVSVWGSEFRNEVNYLRSYIHILRRKLENNPSQPRLIISRPGIGYMLSTTRDESQRN